MSVAGFVDRGEHEKTNLRIIVNCKQVFDYWVAVGEPSHRMRTGLSPKSKNV